MTLNAIQEAIKDDMEAYSAKIEHARTHLEPGARELSDLLRAELDNSDYFQAQLVAIGYGICGGTDLGHIAPIARIIQITHAAAQLTARGDVLAGANALHVAMALLANVNAPESLRIKALSITHRSMMLHTQALAATVQDSDSTIHCYATEEVLNPLHVGMVFTGVGCPETDAITPFALAWGRALRTMATTDQNHASAQLQGVDFWPPEQLAILRKFYTLHT